MIFDNKIALSALKYLAGETVHVCRLCFASTESGEAFIEDNINVKTSYCEESVSIATMFSTLGVSSESQLPQVLCIKCSKNVVNAYLCHKLCQFSNDTWISVLHRLSDSLAQCDSMSQSTRSIYLMINEEDARLFISRKHTSGNKKMALLKIKDIIKSRRKYSKLKQAVVDTICEECGERFSVTSDLIKHLKIHGKSQNQCPTCPKIFSSPLLLESHRERVHYPKTLQCPKCPKKFSTSRTLRIHEQAFHAKSVCNRCSRVFPSKKELQHHEASHQTNICQRCNKKFRNRHTFKLHLKICGNTRQKISKFICDICSKAYTCKNSVRTHLKIEHGFGNAISCDWCNKKFDAISRLRNHIVKHTKEKNFHCEHCSGKFVSQAALVYHTRLHTGERPFHCDLCDESFLSASRRLDHMRRKHYGPTKECDICHVKFVTSHQLRKHVQRHYNPHSKLYVKKDVLKMGKFLPIT